MINDDSELFSILFFLKPWFVFKHLWHFHDNPRDSTNQPPNPAGYPNPPAAPVEDIPQMRRRILGTAAEGPFGPRLRIRQPGVARGAWRETRERLGKHNTNGMTTMDIPKKKQQQQQQQQQQPEIPCGSTASFPNKFTKEYSPRMRLEMSDRDIDPVQWHPGCGLWKNMTLPKTNRWNLKQPL